MNWEGFRFADPAWLYGIGLLPAAAAAFFWVSRARRSTLFMGNPRLVENAPGFFSVQLVPWALRSLVLVLCLLAAARPQMGQKKVEEKKPVTDLFVALDVSGSMITNDLKPDRITAAKKILAGFLDKVEDARVGLTVFAKISFTQCPLTTDVAVMKKLLDNVDIFSVKLADGTAIGDALISSLARLQNGSGKELKASPEGPSFLSKWIHREEPAPQEEGSYQAIILLTDGGNNWGQMDPLVAAKIAASRGVKIYGIGVGSDRRVPMPFIRPDGSTTYGVDPSGQIVMSEPCDMVLLTEISRITGGKAYKATDNGALKAVLADIAKLEKREAVTVTHWEYREAAPALLLAVFLLLTLDAVLGMTVLRTLP